MVREMPTGQQPGAKSSITGGLMGMVSHSGHDEAALGLGQRERRRGAHMARHATGSAASAESEDTAPPAEDTPVRPNLLVRAYRTVRDYLPRGNTLDEETFQRRHLLLCWLLALHVPVLWVMGVWRGYGVAHVTAEISVPLAAVAFARLARNRRLASFFTTFGLVYCSSVLVHLSGGMVEAHFHFFVLIGLIALYQDWVPLVWNVVFTLLSHGAGSALASGLIFNHDAGQNKPWLWAVIHASAVLAASAGVVIFWKNTEIAQQRNVALVEHLGAVEIERTEAMSGLLVNLARRNQSLLNRQLEVITDLELREQQADVLEELFRLDHLATRIRRNAESLLVLSGDDPPRRWGSPVPLGDVVRAAAAEIEDYRRVEVLVSDHIDVAGRAVADLAHLLAELIENATTFSPPSSEVRIRSHLAPAETNRFVVAIEDVGIGMSDDDLRAANRVLTDAPALDLQRATMLGFHVVARLAQRYDIQVRLAATPGGGLTALVSLPRELVSDRPADAPPPNTSGLAGLDRYQRAAIAWSGDGRRPSLAGSTGPWAGRVPEDDAASAPVAASASAPSALPERVPPSLAPAWLTTPMPPWYEPAIPVQSAPMATASPFGTTSLIGGTTTPPGAHPTRLDPGAPPFAPATSPTSADPGFGSAPFDPTTPSGSPATGLGPAALDPTTPGSRPTGLGPAAAPLDPTTSPGSTQPSGFDPGAAPLDALPRRLDARAAPLDPATSPTPADPGFDPAAAPFDAGSTPLDAQPAGLDPATAAAGAQPNPLGAPSAASPAAFAVPPAPAEAASAAPTQPAPRRARPAPVDAQPSRPAASEASRVVPRASGAAAQVHPGTRLGPVAAWVELQKSSAAPAAPSSPPASAPTQPEPETTSWWAGLVKPGTATPVARASIWPSVAAGPQPLDVASTPVPPVAVADTDPDGLARRVPGSHLAPALRRDAPGRPTNADSVRDAERVRAMLSRFQASQNAGRVAADGSRPRSPEENR
jgi:signal transduction histidine kinase